MTTSVQIRTPAYGDGLTYAAQEDRLHTGLLLDALGGATGNALGVGSGVRDATGNPLQVSVTSGLSVQVNTGAAAIQGSAAANSGTYTAVSDTVVTLTCTAADTVNPRIDSVCLTVTDNGDATTTAVIQIVAGTPASSPSAPSLPANSLLLCNITVAANATALTSGNLSDQRRFTAATGGIQPVLNSGFYPTVGSSAMYLHDISTGRLKRMNSSSGIVAPSVVGFAPVSAGPDSITAFSSTYVPIVTATVTVDGSTSVKLIASWSYVDSTTVAGNKGWLTFFRGSTLLRKIQIESWGTNAQLDGGTAVYVDPAPAAGTYAYSFQVATQGSGAFAPHDTYLYVEAQPS